MLDIRLSWLRTWRICAVFTFFLTISATRAMSATCVLTYSCAGVGFARCMAGKSSESGVLASRPYMSRYGLNPVLSCRIML